MSELFYNVSDDARIIINEVIQTLYTVTKDSRNSYPVKIEKGNGIVELHFESREQHLQSMIEWAIDFIGGNINLDGDFYEK